MFVLFEGEEGEEFEMTTITISNEEIFFGSLPSCQAWELADGQYDENPCGNPILTKVQK